MAACELSPTTTSDAESRSADDPSGASTEACAARSGPSDTRQPAIKQIELANAANCHTARNPPAADWLQKNRTVLSLLRTLALAVPSWRDACSSRILPALAV
jgi:hypothetical protein